MKPYYQRDGIALYHANCMDLFPHLQRDTFDALVTDPPYSSGGQTIAARSMDPRDKYCQNGQDLGRPSFIGDNRDQRSFGWWCTLWLSACYELLKPAGYALVFSDWRQLPLMSDVLQAGHFTWRGVITWDKGGGSRAPHKGYFRHQCEFVAWGTKGKCQIATHSGPYPGCFKYPVKQADKFHMTGKPTPLMHDLVQCVPPGGLIFDPFAGSSTTAVACQQSGRRWIGCEISEQNCEISAKRLESFAAT